MHRNAWAAPETAHPEGVSGSKRPIGSIALGCRRVGGLSSALCYAPPLLDAQAGTLPDKEEVE